MRTRWTTLVSIAFLAAVVVVFVFACKQKAASADTQSAMQTQAAAPAAAAPAAQENSMENPYTKDNPGPWASKAEAHIPQITFEKTGGGLRVTVKIDNHPMDSKTPHYIMWIKLHDGDGNSLGEKDFVATDPAPVATFDIMSMPQKLKAFERCNIHGYWMNEIAVTAQ